MTLDHIKISNSPLPISDFPKVTVITAVYNAEKYLDQCIKSVLNQSYRNFEYIIIDGGSTDGTVDIIKKYQHQLGYWVSEPDKGIYDAWNKGLAVAKGAWISFLGADDLLEPDALQAYVEHISVHPKQTELEFVSSHIEVVDVNLSPIYIAGEAWTWSIFKRRMCTWHVGCFHSRNLFKKYGIFDPTYKISGDYELLLRPKNHLVASFFNHITVKMRVGGVSSVRLYQAMEETFRAKVKNGVMGFYEAELRKIVDRLRLLKKRLKP